MEKWRSIADIRREYGDLALDEESLPPNPFIQFQQWFSEVLKTELSDPTAMILSTVDNNNHPDSRVVLLKGIENESFIFYTNYSSSKAHQLRHMPYAALNFYWPQMARQVRIRGEVLLVSEAQSDEYFASRPITSQIGAIVSQQSHVIASRQELEAAFNELIAKNGQESAARPKTWGGYQVCPNEFEFWQGRTNRLHDRIQYCKTDNGWQFMRLAP